MMPGFPPVAGTKTERKLLALYKSLAENDRQTLIKFAEFLAHFESQGSAESPDSTQQPTDSTIPVLPVLIERPAQESVIKAIKRLNKSYPMLDKSTLLDRISGLMTEHLMKGRDAVSVIDELEEVFKMAYEETKS